jgi:hypothetical protein
MKKKLLMKMLVRRSEGLTARRKTMRAIWQKEAQWEMLEVKALSKAKSRQRQKGAESSTDIREVKREAV